MANWIYPPTQDAIATIRIVTCLDSGIPRNLHLPRLHPGWVVDPRLDHLTTQLGNLIDFLL